MQQLHLVGFTTDLDGLIFSARRGSKSGGFLVVLDDQLLRSIEEASRIRGTVSPGGTPERADETGASRAERPSGTRPESLLTPREMQARLRAGRTVAEVATEAGMDDEWVSRFAAPIAAEQARVVDRARALLFTKPRVGESGHPLGTAVRLNLSDRGVRLAPDEFDGGWSAWNLDGTTWAVRFAYHSRQHLQVAEWEIDVADGHLSARNRLGSQLGFSAATRRRRIDPGLPAPAVTAAARRPARRRRPAKRAAAVKAPVKRAPAKKKVVAKKAAVRKAPARPRPRPARPVEPSVEVGARLGLRRRLRGRKPQQVAAAVAPPSWSPGPPEPATPLRIRADVAAAVAAPGLRRQRPLRSR